MGNQACDPHERGTGPLRPHELIILDIFPRVTRTGYYGDMTRTYLKGRPTDAQRKLVATVREAPSGCHPHHPRPGWMGSDVHELVNFVFSQAGYKDPAGPRGFLGSDLSTAPGMGFRLDVHEPSAPMSAVSCKLKAGTVVTVEPTLLS